MEGDAKNSSHTRDASFSSYLSRTEGNFVVKLAGSVQNHPPAMTLNQKTEEAEISVFGAERYFNMVLEDDGPRVVDYNNSKLEHKKEKRADHHLKQPKISRPGTPSACTEASWNSQSALLPSLRNPSQNKKKKVHGKKIFSSFRCNGCSDEKSIYIHEISVGHGGRHGKNMKQSQPRFKAKDEVPYSNFERSNKEEHSAVKILISGSQNLGAKSQLGEKKTKEEEDPRKSLEVFGTRKGDIVAINLERRRSMLAWDAIPKSQSLSTTSETGQVIINEDMESDASSDLFEIENLPGSGQLMFTKQASDGLSMASTTMYESSETSIGWSVVTGGVVSAAASDYDEKKVAAKGRTPTSTSKSVRVKREGKN